MDELSIYNSVTLLRGIDPDEVMEIEAGLRKNMGYSHVYQKRYLNDLYSSINSMLPLTTKLRHRYLFCLGKNGVYCLYANSVFGSDPGLANSTASRLNIDFVTAYWDNYEDARKYDRENMPADLNYEFNIEVRLKTQGDRCRTVGCIIARDGQHDWRWDGDLFPFESASDYIHLKEGVPPGKHILNGFCNLLGWPSPTTDDFPKFIKSCILYEYLPNKEFPDIPINDRLQAQMIRWPWNHTDV